MSNTANKYKFVGLLSEYWRCITLKNHIYIEDADALIVNTAKNLLSKGEPLRIAGNDDDIFFASVALTTHSDNINCNKIVPGEKGNELYCTIENHYFRSFRLFVHAFTGYDTTPQTHFPKKEKQVFWKC